MNNFVTSVSNTKAGLAFRMYNCTMWILKKGEDVHCVLGDIKKPVEKLT